MHACVATYMSDTCLRILHIHMYVCVYIHVYTHITAAQKVNFAWLMLENELTKS
jgi:hypothetical protein